ncbi:MAG: PQQ-dependent sugar dehydrogenase [Desulfofustis sp.]|jgi:glucose/arabinose dehydrogenase|nr:PQQ-dependent sugar dehydrogenase [Desulfofustis sp.]
MYSTILTMVMVWLAAATAAADEPYRLPDGRELRLEAVASGLGVVWGMSFIDEHRLMVTERQGRIGIVDLRDGSYRDVAGGPQVLASGQGGLLDVAAEPGYTPGGYLYFTYVKDVGDGRGATTLARGRLIENRLADWQDLLVTRSATDTTRHFGSRIAFDGAGHVFFSIGDRGQRELAQDLASHAGTVLRLQLDGSLPPDNPLVGVQGALPEIWSWGHRNIQGLAYDAATDRLWAIEHGPRGGDELNLVRPGRNYGWPDVSHGMEYWGPIPVGEARERQGMESPVKVYIPSIAPSSLLVYDGEAMSAWRGSLLAGALVLRHLNRITVDGEGRAVAEERLLEDRGERIRSLAVDRQGVLYLGTDSGLILRLAPAG